MFYRIRQFYLAWTAKITDADRVFINKYLSPQEKGLFDRLNIATQKHSILVAQAAIKAYYPITDSRDEDKAKILIKAALLHDIGKSVANLHILHKTLYVLLKKFMPAFLKNLANKSTTKSFSGFTGLAQAMYVAENHATIGAALAEEWGLDKNLAAIIANHHKKSDSTLSEIIRQVDEKL